MSRAEVIGFMFCFSLLSELEYAVTSPWAVILPPAVTLPVRVEVPETERPPDNTSKFPLLVSLILLTDTPLAALPIVIVPFCSQYIWPTRLLVLLKNLTPPKFPLVRWL